LALASFAQESDLLWLRLPAFEFDHTEFFGESGVTRTLPVLSVSFSSQATAAALPMNSWFSLLSRLNAPPCAARNHGFGPHDPG